MPVAKKLASLAFLVSALALGIFATVHFDYDGNRVLLYFLIPYYVITAALQYVIPLQPNDYDRRELMLDSVSNVGAILMGAVQTSLGVAIAAYAVPNLLVEHGIVAPEHTLSALPFVAQVLLLFLVSDFFYYWAHRLSHEVPLLWRLHSVHHCGTRISVLNASRVHPLDLVVRRIIPMLLTLQLTGASPAAVMTVGVIGSVLGTITHMNTVNDYGFVNYFIGTNQVHRWHHSTVYDEAKNFGLTMTWDHLFGTYFFPKDRSGPEKLGLGDARFYPVDSYLGQLMVPFRWSELEARQKGESAAPADESHAAREPMTRA